MATPSQGRGTADRSGNSGPPGTDLNSGDLQRSTRAPRIGPGGGGPTTPACGGAPGHSRLTSPPEIPFVGSSAAGDLPDLQGENSTELSTP